VGAACFEFSFISLFGERGGGGGGGVDYNGGGLCNPSEPGLKF